METIKNYEQALAYLKGKKERPYAHNTRIESAPSFDYLIVTVKYHGNPIVRFYPNFTAFNSCGWKTLTTKERLNWFLPEGFSIYQERSVWYLVDRRGGWENAKRYIFNDGMMIDENGNVSNAAADDDSAKKTIKRIKKYVDGYIKALLNKEVPAPSSGDCWYCLMRTENGESLGDATKNNDHIESHFEESYYVPSLLVNAVKFKDVSILAKDGVARLWQGESLSEWQQDVTAQDVKRSLTAYLKHVLNIAA